MPVYGVEGRIGPPHLSFAVNHHGQRLGGQRKTSRSVLALRKAEALLGYVVADKRIERLALAYEASEIPFLQPATVTFNLDLQEIYNHMINLTK